MSNKGIKMSDCKFYVNEEERIVVCVIPETEKMIEDYIFEHGRFSDLVFWYSLEGRLQDKLQMPSSFCGKAVCAPEDEWDEGLGKMIAFSRAKDKCYKSFFKRANLFIQSIDARLGQMIESFNDFGMRLETKREALQNKIDEKIGVEKEE